MQVLKKEMENLSFGLQTAVMFWFLGQNSELHVRQSGKVSCASSWTIEPAICWNEDDIGWSPKTAENLVYLYMYINPVNEYNAMVVNQNKLHEGFFVEHSVCWGAVPNIMEQKKPSSTALLPYVLVRHFSFCTPTN